MKRAMYEELQSVIPGFDSRWVQDIPVDKIRLDKHNSQIRKNGAVVQKVPQMVEDIKVNGQEIPATVKPLPNGCFELKDGITRWLANKQLNQPLKASTYHASIFTHDDEWVEHQVKSNNHETCSPHTKDDIMYQVHKMIASGMLERQLGYKYLGNEQRFLKDAPKYLKDIYTHTGPSRTTFKTIVKNTVGATLTPSRYENYTQAQALELFEQYNKYGWTGSKVGEICNNVSVYTLKNSLDRKDLYGNTYKKLHENPNIDIYVVFWVNTLAGLDDSGLKKQRQKLYDIYKIAQNHRKGWTPMYRGAFFLPQFKSGSLKENMYKLYTPQELGLK